ncbi:MAG TPA: MOSC domain-containing protein [Polyangiaceae bacterium]|nr:MOSC domain-containing protein [Polyangiaceae bacterium]
MSLPSLPSLRELAARFPSHGTLRWIGLRPAQGSAMSIAPEVEVLAQRGLKGDRTSLRTGGERQVTLFQFEHLAVLASLLGRDQVLPQQLRRNLAVSGINLLALRTGRFTIGGVPFQGTGPCAPCRRLEQTLGPGGFNASRGHGGITARVLGDGWLRLGDEVVATAASEDTDE